MPVRLAIALLFAALFCPRALCGEQPLQAEVRSTAAAASAVPLAA